MQTILYFGRYEKRKNISLENRRERAKKIPILEGSGGW